jgi:hypothetical protein
MKNRRLDGGFSALTVILLTAMKACGISNLQQTRYVNQIPLELG